MEKITERIFNISTDEEFNDLAVEIFRFQYKNNNIYKQFTDLINIKPEQVFHYSEIPFLPIEFFKTHDVVSFTITNERFFESSGTTGQIRSRHYIFDEKLYTKSLDKGFRYFYGKPEDHCIIALTPDPIQSPNSSLVFMLDELINFSRLKESGFYLNRPDEIIKAVKKINSKVPSKKVFLFGLTYALLDISEKYDFAGQNLTIIETGGMKGRREEITRPELYNKLKEGFGINEIHSEYSMTELMSQAYSSSNGRFFTPPWMKVITRELNDPKSICESNKTGGVNIIDLANIYSCSFIATQDLGVLCGNDGFEITGRFDHSDLRGCSLMYQ